MPAIETAVKDMSLDSYYEQALNLIASGRARDAFALDRESEKLRDR